MTGDLGLAYEITILSEIEIEKLELKDLLPIYFALKTYMKILDPKESIRLKSQLIKVTKLIKHARHIQKNNERLPMAVKYLDKFKKTTY